MAVRLQEYDRSTLRATERFSFTSDADECCLKSTLPSSTSVLAHLHGNMAMCIS
jgi:hypothetical protein